MNSITFIFIVILFRFVFFIFIPFPFFWSITFQIKSRKDGSVPVMSVCSTKKVNKKCFTVSIFIKSK